MPQNIFKIYDGRTSFWQWDRKQKLIVLDEDVTQVHFSNRNMTHSIKKDVYVNKDNIRVCNVPDDLLKIPANLVAYAMVDGATVKSVKFAVVRRPMPSDYISDQSEEIEDRLTQIDIKIEALNDSKADDIYYDAEDQSIQLVANGELIGNKVAVATGEVCSVVDCKINEEEHLIVTLSNGKTIDAGYVGATDGVTFTPHVSDDLILSWTNDGGLENPEPVDISPFNDWVELGDDGETDSQYTWDFM